MGKYFNDKVEEAVSLIWTQFDIDKMRHGAELLAEAANEGDADAVCFLARCYMGKYYVWEGAGFPVDGTRAADYIKDSVLKGSAIGTLCAMRCNELTPSVRKNMPFKTLKEPFDEVLAKAEAGHPFCQYAVGNAYFWGDMIEIDQLDLEKDYPTEQDYNNYAYPIALKWFEKAVQGGLTLAVSNIRAIYREGCKSIDKSEEMARKWERIGADMGDPKLLFNIGTYYEQEENYQEALTFYEKAAALGDDGGYMNAGWIYEYGNGVDIDLKRAFEYYLEAAKRGNVNAYFKVGDFYFIGEGVEQDYAKAAFWLDKAAGEEYEWAYPQLAYCYLKGKGVQQDYKTAYRLLKKAQEKKDELNDMFNGITLNCLGEMHANGLGGLEENIKQGVAYFKEAIECGNNDAKLNMALYKKTLFGKWVRRS